MTISRLLEASTAHLTAAEHVLLTRAGAGLPIGDCPPVVRNLGTGWLVWVPDLEIGVHQRAYRDCGFSATFTRLLAFARQRDCRHVLLDRDADPIQGVRVVRH